MTKESILYAVTGAAGNTGRGIAEILLSNGKKVRVIGRSAERLKGLVGKGAEAFVGSLDDPGSVARAFEGAGAAYVMVPPNLAAPDLRAYQVRVGEAQTAAIRAAGVRYVVNLSSVGGHLASEAGPINGLHDVEERLNQLDEVSVLNLRPTFFLENLFFQIHLIKNMGIAGSPLRADLPMAMIATRDIAAVAAEHLLHLDFSGKSARELLGQREVTMTEAARILGGEIGKKDLAYLQFPYEDAEKAMAGAGMSPDMARGMIEMYRGFNEGKIRPREPRTPKNTTPTSIEEFAKVFASAYAGQAGRPA